MTNTKQNTKPNTKNLDDIFSVETSSEEKTAIVPDEYLTLSAAAELLNLSRQTIWRKLTDGVLPGEKQANGRWRIPKRELLLHLHILQETPKNLKHLRPIEEIPDDEIDAVVTIDAAAKFLNLSPEYTRQLLRTQKIKGRKDESNSWLVYVQSVKMYSQGNLRYAGLFGTRYYKIALTESEAKLLSLQFDITPLYSNDANKGTTKIEETEKQFGDSLSDIVPDEEISSISKVKDNWRNSIVELEEIALGEDRKIFSDPTEIIRKVSPAYDEQLLDAIFNDLTKEQVIELLLKKQMEEEE